MYDKSESRNTWYLVSQSSSLLHNAGGGETVANMVAHRGMFEKCDGKDGRAANDS